MHRKNFIHQEFGRRTLLMGAGKTLLLSALGARMYYLQILDSDKYKTQADGNRIRLYPILPNRGRIVDRNGEVMAEGSKRYQVLYRKGEEDEAHIVVERIADLLSFDFNHRQELLQKVEEHKSDAPLLLDDFLTWEEVAKVEVNRVDLPGIEISSPEVRNYPQGDVTAHITGYIGKPSDRDKGDGPLTNHPDYRIGKTGMEKTADERLRGVAGVHHVEVDSFGRFVRELNEEPAIRGDDVTLTIDVELQKFVKEKLSKKGGLLTEGATAVVLDIENGDVLAMASVPTYDPNQFVRGIKQDYWDGLINNPDNPLSNKAISLQYPPGSTYKIMTALAGLEAGVITPKTTQFCNGSHVYGGRRFHCWNRYGHGEVDMTKAIAVSCNVYFYKIAAKIGIDKMAEVARKFGLGEKTGIELPHEKSGLVPDKAWKRSALDKPWYGGETLNNAIGQGFLLSTPLQLATMVARIGSAGKKVKPRLVLPQNQFGYQGNFENDDYEMVALDNGKRIVLPKEKVEFEKIDINPWHMDAVMQGMDDVVNKSYGGSHRVKLEDKFAMAGKTGTAQVRSNRRWKHVPRNRADRYHALYIGYAPIHKPKYAVSVVVEHGGYGSVTAAPLGSAILLKVQQMAEDKA